jgi:hypothetical protein
MDPNAPPPPWFFLALAPVMAASAGIVIASIGATIARLRRRPVAQLAAPVPDPQVARLQAEVDELRLQVERLTAAESFYAQLQRPTAAHAIAGGD